MAMYRIVAEAAAGAAAEKSPPMNAMKAARRFVQLKDRGCIVRIFDAQTGAEIDAEKLLPFVDWIDGSGRLTLKQALDDLGWFWAIFTSLVNAPSILSLLQMVFLEHRLIDALQWIVDGYNDIAAQLGAWCEPVLQPVWDWLNTTFGWSLSLMPHWRPAFILTMLLVLAFVRQSWRHSANVGKRGWSPTATPQAARGQIGIAAIGLGVGALLGAVATGLIPLDGRWWVQGLAAGMPILITFAAAEIIETVLRNLDFAGRKRRRAMGLSPWSFDTLMLQAGLVLGALAFGLGAAISFIPYVAAGAGLLSLGALVFAAGAMTLLQGLSKGDRMWSRVGLTVLGGFVVAGIILAADAAVKLLNEHGEEWLPFLFQ
jgi:hypothetical protein